MGRRTLTALGRAGVSEVRIGTKKRAFRSNKKRRKKDAPPCLNLLTKKAPYKGHPPVLASPNPLSTLLQRFACARLSRPCLPESRPGVSATLTTTAFDRSSLRWLGIGDLITEPEGPSFISRTVAHHRLDRRCL